MKPEDSTPAQQTYTNAQITETEVLKMFSLSKLAPPTEGLAKFVDEFNSILSFFGALNDVDTTHVQELAQVHDTVNIFRTDEITASFDATVALQNAPEQHEQCFKVPMVIES